MLSALALGGCVEVLGLDRFTIGDDDAGRDGGAQRPDGGGDMDGGGDRDAGRDACVPVTYYADLDEDGYGDPETATESCTPIEGHVTNADDCDDADGEVRPGATETCDDVDQDCDGAVDEGLMRPLGDPIVVEPRLGLNDGHASLAAFSTGYAVVWRTEDAADVYASFYGLDGVPIIERRVVESADDPDGPPREPTILRYVTPTGVEQLIVAYFQTSQISWRIYSPSGTASGFILDVPAPADASDLQLARVGDRVAMFWRSGGSGFLATFEPPFSAWRGPLELPGATSKGNAIATVGGVEPYVLVTQASDDPTSEVVKDLLRIYDSAPLTAESLGEIVPAEMEARCAALDASSCLSVGILRGHNARPGYSDLALLHAVHSFDGAGEYLGSDLDIIGLRPVAGELAITRVHSAAPSFFAVNAVALRGTLAVFIESDGAGGNVLHELALGPMGSGRGPIPLAASQDLSYPVGSMLGNHGAFLGSADEEIYWNASLLRIGCEP